MKPYTWKMCIIAAAAATAAAGCGASSSSNAGSSPGPTIATTQPGDTISSGSTLSGPDACALLTNDQVASATKHEVRSHAARTPLLGASECVWDLVSHGYSQNDVAQPQVTVTVYLTKVGTPRPRSRTSVTAGHR